MARRCPVLGMIMCDTPIMSTFIQSFAVAAVIFAASLIGLALHPRLPSKHRAAETYAVVRLGVGMLSVLASLVLGLLIATAKGANDSADTAMRSYAAELILLDETFRDYGDAAAAPRAVLHRFTRTLLHDYWPEVAQGAADPVKTDRLLEQVREATRALAPVDAGQTWLRDQALGINVGLLRQRWLLIERAEPAVRPVVVMILVSWIAFIFASFGLDAPRNATVIVSFAFCALAIGGAMFLVLELDSPLAGLMKISSWPIDNALRHMLATP